MLMKFKRIDDIRIDNDLTIKQMASILGISKDNFFDYANGRSNFPIEKLDEMVSYFKVGFDYITGLSNVKRNFDKKASMEILKFRLKEVRCFNKFSQDYVAKVIGDNQSTYWNYESGRSIIPISKLYLLSKFYNVSIDYFVGKTDDMKIAYDKVKN